MIGDQPDKVRKNRESHKFRGVAMFEGWRKQDRTVSHASDEGHKFRRGTKKRTKKKEPSVTQETMSHNHEQKRFMCLPFPSKS
mmetsp:Transcript_13772/g.38769  ORF Transcript_13772/g.38769 Transcript_13772/m.38769 type:complete len:83 (+) Transcript_13772:271-519(+)